MIDPRPSVARGARADDEPSNAALIVDHEVTLAVPIEHVWAGLADRHQRQQWFPHLELDPRRGGVLCERWIDDEGAENVTRGQVVRADPPQRLTATWADEGWPAPTRLDITMTATALGTRVRVRHTGWEMQRNGEQLAHAHRDGWRAHLHRLARYLLARPDGR